MLFIDVFMYQSIFYSNKSGVLPNASNLIIFILHPGVVMLSFPFTAFPLCFVLLLFFIFFYLFSAFFIFISFFPTFYHFFLFSVIFTPFHVSPELPWVCVSLRARSVCSGSAVSALRCQVYRNKVLSGFPFITGLYRCFTGQHE